MVGVRAKKQRQQLTHLQSVNVIRNMIRVSISEICYLRNLFPDDMFKDRVYADLNIKCLAPQKEKMSRDTDDALKISKWLEDGVFEALENKYLKTLVFCIYSLSMGEQPHELLESYVYNIENTENGASRLSTSFTGANHLDLSPDKVKAQAIQMIRSLVSISNTFNPLPSNRILTMKMFFNDQCPQGWHPKCFHPTSPEYVDSFSNPSHKLDVGKVVTPYHKVSMEVEVIEDTLKSFSDLGSQVQCSQHFTTSGPPLKDDLNCATQASPINLTQEEQAVNSPNCDLYLTQTDGSQSELDIKSVANSQSQTQVPIPTYEEFLSFVLLKDKTSETMLCERFPALPNSKLDKWLEEFCKQGLLSKGLQGYTVCVHDSTLFNRAVHETHGKLRRHITSHALSSALNVSILVGKALLVRMEQQNLVEKSTAGSYFGFKVIFTETTRELIRKAIQTASKVEVNKDKTELASVYDFAADDFVTPTTKRKLVTKYVKSSSTTLPSVSSCANEPIIQVRKALKRRRLALKK